jgi:hypothetical protein
LRLGVVVVTILGGAFAGTFVGFRVCFLLSRFVVLIEDFEWRWSIRSKLLDDWNTVRRARIEFCDNDEPISIGNNMTTDALSRQRGTYRKLRQHSIHQLLFVPLVQLHIRHTLACRRRLDTSEVWLEAAASMMLYFDALVCACCVLAGELSTVHEEMNDTKKDTRRCTQG